MPCPSQFYMEQVKVLYIFIMYLSLILPGKMNEKTLSFSATTWGIFKRGMNEPIKSGDDMRARLWILAVDIRVNTPSLTISVMGSLRTAEIQDTNLMSHPKDSTLHRAMSPITTMGHWDVYIFKPEEGVPPSGSPTPLPVASGLPSRDWSGWTLLSFRSKLAVGCRVVCC